MWCWLLLYHGTQRSSLEALTKKLNLEERVFFLGFTDDMVSFYQALDLYCLPSRNEGFPLSTLEAQSCNVRCVATDVGGVKEAICPESDTSDTRQLILNE